MERREIRVRRKAALKKTVVVLGLLLGAGWVFNALDYSCATVLKAPLYVTGLSGRRFIKFRDETVSRIEFEDVDGELRRVNDDLSGIDAASFHPLDSATTVDGVGQVDIRYRDKNYLYLIHDGEEKYLVRQPRTMQ